MNFIRFEHINLSSGDLDRTWQLWLGREIVLDRPDIAAHIESG